MPDESLLSGQLHRQRLQQNLRETPNSVTLNSHKPGEVNPPRTIYLPSVYCQERAAYKSQCIGKIRGVRISFNISEGRCIGVTVLKKICCPSLQALFINSKPFYSPQDFPPFILAGVYIPPQACGSELRQGLVDQITSMELEHTDSLFIILGDFFKRANLSNEVHKYRRYIKYPTGNRNTPSQRIKRMLTAPSAIKLLNLLIIHLPTYREQTLKSTKPLVN